MFYVGNEINMVTFRIYIISFTGGGAHLQAGTNSYGDQYPANFVIDEATGQNVAGEAWGMDGTQIGKWYTVGMDATTYKDLLLVFWSSRAVEAIITDVYATTDAFAIPGQEPTPEPEPTPSEGPVVESNKFTVNNVEYS